MSARPRLGFLGTGWIGRTRLESVVAAGVADVVALADANPSALERARELAPNATFLSSYEALLEQPLDAVVIATPSGQHAEQCVRAFERGLAVHCQKPLGRSAGEVAAVVAAARRANRALGVDFCYRETAALRSAREAVERGAIGRPFAVDATFHNAYGPDQSWANDAVSAGGGCLVDLGVHLLDAALALLPEAEPVACSSALFASGRPLALPAREVEDFALGELVFANGAAVRLACSWRSSFGADAAIRIACFGSEGSVVFENVNGSFFDFRAELYRGKERTELAAPPDAWGGRGLVRWIEGLAADASYHEDARLLPVARKLDLLYGRGALVARATSATFATPATA